jgi:hypothetical protein
MQHTKDYPSAYNIMIIRVGHAIRDHIDVACVHYQALSAFLCGGHLKMNAPEHVLGENNLSKDILDVQHFE